MKTIEDLANRYGPVISQLPGLCSLRNCDSRNIATNDFSAQLIGYKHKEACIGITDYDIRCEAVNLADVFVKEDQATLSTGKTKQLYFSKYSDGEVKIFLCTKTRFYDVDNSVIGIFAQCHDVTEISEMQNIVLDSLFSYDKLKNTSKVKSVRYEFKLCYDSIKLTRRESEVFFYLIRKHSTKHISQDLRLSPRTIEKHIEHIMMKLSCNHRHQLRELAEEKQLAHVLLKGAYRRSHLKK